MEGKNMNRNLSREKSELVYNSNRAGAQYYRIISKILKYGLVRYGILALALWLVTLSALADCPTNFVVNLDARVNGDPQSFAGTPVTVNLPAGVYRTTLIDPGIDSRATFTDWFPFNNHSLAEITDYAIAITETNGSRNTIFRWEGGSFTSLTNRVGYFTNSVSEDVLFGVGDQILSDNAGGVSLLIEFTQPVISIQPAVIVKFFAASGSQYQLQSAPNANSTNFTNVGAPITGSCSNVCITQPASTGSGFFRVAVTPGQ